VRHDNRPRLAGAVDSGRELVVEREEVGRVDACQPHARQGAAARREYRSRSVDVEGRQRDHRLEARAAVDLCQKQKLRVGPGPRQRPNRRDRVPAAKLDDDNVAARRRACPIHAQSDPIRPPVAVDVAQERAALRAVARDVVAWLHVAVVLPAACAEEDEDADRRDGSTTLHAMRIAYVVDVHDRFDSVPRALDDIGDVDALIVGGDITTGGTPDDAAQAVESWQRLAPTLLALAGNMDSPAIDARLADLGVSLDGRGVRVGDVGLFGVSAAPRSPLRTPYEIDDEELVRRIESGFKSVGDCRVKIFCPHAPPEGTACDRLRSGEHVGSEVIRAFVEREQPDLVLCGHIHESRGVDEIGRTQILNPGPVLSGHYAVVEVDGGLSVQLDGS
jgi:Icc-related predicted phosphoesterase